LPRTSRNRRRIRFDWHEAPERQYVITLAGTLEFTTPDGEKCIIRPGEVLVATDTAGSGHNWRLIDDQPWRRCYVVSVRRTGFVHTCHGMR
jgi:quercetin dioxygenase-like cupin family protein